MCEQAVVRTFAVANKSFTASGMPSSGWALPTAMRASQAFAMAKARSGVSSTKALSTRAFSMAARWASASSTAEKDFFFSPSRASASVSEFKSLTDFHYGFALIRRRWRGGRGCVRGRVAGKARGLLAQDPLLRLRRQRVDHGPKVHFTGDAHLLDHLRNEKEMIFCRRRVLHDVLGDPAVGEDVLPLLHRHRRHRGHRLDALDVYLLQLLDEGQHGIELALQMRHLVLGHGDARQMRDAADGIGVDGHAFLRIRPLTGAYSTRCGIIRSPRFIGTPRHCLRRISRV